jgi:hypothetical protein
MFRFTLWALLAAFLLLVGAWPAAATPIGLLGAGVETVLGLIPGPVLALAVVVAYLASRSAPKPRIA